VYTGDSHILDFQGESLLSAGEADGVFQVSLNAVNWPLTVSVFRRIWMPMRSS
jgi:hypothetical protein